MYEYVIGNGRRDANPGPGPTHLNSSQLFIVIVIVIVTHSLIILLLINYPNEHLHHTEIHQCGKDYPVLTVVFHDNVPLRR